MPKVSTQSAMKVRTFRVEVQFVVVLAPAHLTIFSANYIPLAGDRQYCVRCMLWRLRSVPAGTDNRAMAGTSWRKRIGRAEELTVHYPFAAELLAFYVPPAWFRGSLSLRRDRTPAARVSGSVGGGPPLQGSR